MDSQLKNLVICWLLHLIIAGVNMPVHAQEMDFKVTRYGESDGLDSKKVRCMIQDRKGILWLGTVEGLSSFDGYKFKMYRKKSSDPNSISSNYITALAEDKNGLIWMGFQQGYVTSYNPETGKFRNYILRDNNNLRYPSQEIRMLYVDTDNDIWISIYRTGFMRLDQETGKCVHYSLVAQDVPASDRKRLYDYVTGICEMEKGKFWMSTADGLYSFDKKYRKLRSVSFPIAEQNYIRSDLFTSIQHNGDQLCMSSWSGGVSFYNTKTEKWDNFKHNPAKVSGTTNIVHGVVRQGNDSLWVTTSNDGGFGYFLKSTGKFHFYKDIFPEGEYFGLWQDRASNLWLFHEKGLLKVRIEKKKFVFHPVSVSKSDNGSTYIISKIFENDKFLLTGTMFADGLHVYNKQTGVSKTLPFEYDRDEKVMIVHDIFQDSRGKIWIITRDYIYHLDENKIVLKKPVQPLQFPGEENTSNFFRRICEDRQGNIWIASRRNGVFVYDHQMEKYIHYSPKEKGAGYIPVFNIATICMDQKGQVWIGGSNGYLAYFSNSSRNFVSISQKSLGEAAGNDVHALITDRKGTIWVGTDAGLLSYEFKKNVPVRTCMLTAEHGLRGDIVYEMCEDKSGKIWCITSSFLCVLKPENHTITNFGSSDGVEYSDTEQRLVLANEHTMRFSLARGYYEFDPAFLKLKRKPVPVLITSLKVNDEERYYEPQIHQDGKISLAAGEDQLSFEFAAVDLGQPEKQHYAYMLEGMDKNWVNCGSRRYASYTNLPGGDYVFKIRASSIDADWEEPAVKLQVHIDTVFYKQWWFRSFMLLLFVCIVYMIFRYRISQEQKICALESRAHSLEKEKAMVMYDSLKQQLNPHFLFNSLTSLSSLIRIDQKKAGEFLEGLSSTYRYILKNRDSELVSLTSEIQFTETYIKLQTTRFEEGLQVNVSINSEYAHWKIAPVTLQNLIENGIKHNKITNDKPLVIDIFTEDDKLVVRNNLQRKNFVETSNRKGLTNICSLYQYLTDRTIEIIENEKFFIVKIPLI